MSNLANGVLRHDAHCVCDLACNQIYRIIMKTTICWLKSRRRRPQPAAVVPVLSDALSQVRGIVCAVHVAAHTTRRPRPW